MSQGVDHGLLWSLCHTSNCNMDPLNLSLGTLGELDVSDDIPVCVCN